MKFIHCADLHLDSKICQLPQEKSKIRRDEVVGSFERLCCFAGKENVTAVIIAGDMFDTQRISINTKNRIVSAIKQNNNVDFLYLSGNHDDFDFISSLPEIPDNLKVFKDEWTSFRYENVVVSGISFNEFNIFSYADSLQLNENDTNIVCLHGQIAGYESAKEGYIISLPELKNKFIDYLALGHIHSFETGKLDTRGVYAYSGCLEGRGFDELNEKGFVMIDVSDKGKISYEFKEFSYRNIYEVVYDVTDENSFINLSERIQSELKNRYNLQSIIKIILKGEHSTDFYIDIKFLSDILNQEFFFVKVVDNTVLRINLTDFSTDKSVKGEFVRTVYGSDMTEEEKRKIILCGLKALKGEDL